MAAPNQRIVQNQTQINESAGFFASTAQRYTPVNALIPRPVLSTLTVASSGGTLFAGGIGLIGEGRSIVGSGGGTESTLAVEDSTGAPQLIGSGNLYIATQTDTNCGSLTQDANGLNINADVVFMQGGLSTLNIQAPRVQGIVSQVDLLVLQSGSIAGNATSTVVTLPFAYSTSGTRVFSATATPVGTTSAAPNVWVSTLSASSFRIYSNGLNDSINWITARLMSG
jgi:hypothetical protein